VNWEPWNRWTLAELPRLNRAILSGAQPPQALTAGLRAGILTELPPPAAVAPADARRLLVLLGLAGASAARHCQEADLARKARPARCFDALPVGAHGIPFLVYFAGLAAASGTGHPQRDCYASLVRWNAPETVVEDRGQVLARLPGSFPGPLIRTYTDDPGEHAFFALLKQSEALELAVNETLEPIADGSIAVLDPEAARRALTATRLLAALIRCNLDFARRPPERGGLGSEHFMDVFRQFAVHWRPGDLPPTGAQDPQFIRRDLLLGIDFPQYPAQVRHILPALLADERAMLQHAMARRPLPYLLLAARGLSPAAVAQCPPRLLGPLVRAHPQLAPWYLLLAANARFGAVHLMLTEKFLFKPQRARDRDGLGDRPLVSNRRGTTGMEEPLLVRLTRARHNHPLRALGRLPGAELAALCGAGALPGAAGLPEVRFAPVPAPG
jgi:hypothetical protein